MGPHYLAELLWQTDAVGSELGRHHNTVAVGVRSYLLEVVEVAVVVAVVVLLLTVRCRVRPVPTEIGTVHHRYSMAAAVLAVAACRYTCKWKAPHD